MPCLLDHMLAVTYFHTLDEITDLPGPDTVSV